MKLYECCKHCESEIGDCPDRHWYPCAECKTERVTLRGKK